MPLSTKIKSTVSLLGALSFFLSAIEFLFPKPLPFIRIGIANLPILLGLQILPFPAFMFLVFIKILGQALISGTLFSYVFIFSLGGTLTSALFMAGINKLLGKNLSLMGISTAGAFASNIVQLYLAYVFIFGSSVRYMAAPVLALGLITGALLGYITEYFKMHSRWYKSLFTGSTEAPFLYQEEFLKKENSSLSLRHKREAFFLGMFNANELAITGLCMLPALLFNSDTIGRVFQCLFFMFLAWLSGKKINFVFTAFVVFFIVFFNLFLPYGEVIFTLASFNITAGALFGGIRRAMTLTGLLMLSRFCIRWDFANFSFNKTGTLGEVIAGSFKVFSILGEKKFSIKKNKWIEGIDNILLSITSSSGVIKKEHKGEQKKAPLRSSRVVSRLLLLSFLVIAWIPFFLALN